MSREKGNMITRFLKTELVKLKAYADSYADNGSGDGEDAIQDVLLNIFDLADFTVPFEELSAYIYRSVKNRLVDMARAKRRENLSMNSVISDNISLEDALADFRENVATESEKNDLRELLFDAVDSLSVQYRDIVIFTEFEGLSYKEVSVMSGIPVNTLLSRKKRALEKIRKYIINEKGENYVSFTFEE